MLSKRVKQTNYFSNSRSTSPDRNRSRGGKHAAASTAKFHRSQKADELLQQFFDERVAFEKDGTAIEKHFRELRECDGCTSHIHPDSAKRIEEESGKVWVLCEACAHKDESNRMVNIDSQARLF